MPVVQEGALCAARSHDQADGEARDHVLPLGASRRGAVKGGSAEMAFLVDVALIAFHTPKGCESRIWET
jgi:hypothetical protein